MSDPKTLAFRAVYETHVEYVQLTLRRLGVPAGDVEDLTHDVFVAVYRELDKYDPARPLRPWLFGFTFRVAGNHRRLARHRSEVPAPLEVELAEDTASLPDARIDEERARELCARAMDALDLDKRAILVMFELEELSAAEIAEQLNVPLNTAYSRIRLARAAFENQIRKLGALR